MFAHLHHRYLDLLDQTIDLLLLSLLPSLPVAYYSLFVLLTLQGSAERTWQRYRMSGWTTFCAPFCGPPVSNARLPLFDMLVGTFVTDKLFQDWILRPMLRCLSQRLVRNKAAFRPPALRPTQQTRVPAPAQKLLRLGRHHRCRSLHHRDGRRPLSRSSPDRPGPSPPSEMETCPSRLAVCLLPARGITTQPSDVHRFVICPHNSFSSAKQRWWCAHRPRSPPSRHGYGLDSAKHPFT